MVDFDVRSATIAHVPMPFSTRGSTLIGVVDHLARCHAEGGGRTLAILSDNRGLEVPHAENILVDHKRYCPQEYFTGSQVLIDAACGFAGFRRPYFGRLHTPSIAAVVAHEANVVLLYEGHYAAASLPDWNKLRPRVRVILYVHNPLSRTYRANELVRLADQCDALVFCADHLRKDAARRIPAVRTPLVTIHNGIDESFLKADGSSRTRQADDFDILFIGRTARHKGPQHLIAALDRAQERSNWRLKCTIIGSENYGLTTGHTPFELELRKMAAQSKVPVEFIGHVDRTTVAELMRH